MTDFNIYNETVLFSSGDTEVQLVVASDDSVLFIADDGKETSTFVVDDFDEFVAAVNKMRHAPSKSSFDQMVAEVAEATANNDHTEAYAIIARNLGDGDDVTVWDLRYIAKDQAEKGYLTPIMSASRDVVVEKLMAKAEAQFTDDQITKLKGAL